MTLLVWDREGPYQAQWHVRGEQSADVARRARQWTQTFEDVVRGKRHRLAGSLHGRLKGGSVHVVLTGSVQFGSCSHQRYI